MRIKIDLKTYEYLLKNILSLEKDIYSTIKTEKEKDFLILELDEDVASMIKDLAGELLQKKGFDENYNLTSEGEVLEKIEDLFYA